jgi:hypothetical protein
MTIAANHRTDCVGMLLSDEQRKPGVLFRILKDLTQSMTRTFTWHSSARCLPESVALGDSNFSHSVRGLSPLQIKRGEGQIAPPPFPIGC